MIRAAVSSLSLVLLLGIPQASPAARRGPARQRVGVVPLSSNGEGADKVAAGVVRAIVAGLKSQHHELKIFDEARAAKLRLCLQQPSCVRSLASGM